MTVRQSSSHGLSAPMPQCWSRIGVAGDRSCPELETFIHCRNCPVLAEAARTFFDRPAPDGYVESWSAILDEPPVAANPDATSVLIFRLGEEWFALPTSVLVEVTTLRPLHTVPHRTGGVLAGIVNIRGQLQLCISLASLLALEARPLAGNGHDTGLSGTTGRLLVVEWNSHRWVFAVDQVAGVHSVPRAVMRSVPSTVSQSSQRATQALFDWQDASVGLLDEARLTDGLAGLVSG